MIAPDSGTAVSHHPTQHARIPADRPCIMGILNITPDSFSDGGRFHDHRLAIQHGLRLAQQGADIIDIGGESTRPGSLPVDAAEELRRVLPVVEELAGRCGLSVSIDTMKSSVARAALEAGACMINDVSALTYSPDMAAVAADANVPVVLMHMPAMPRDMQQHTAYADIVADIRRYLEQRIEAACAAGIAPRNIILDPGIGFGKTVLEGNFTLLARLREFTALGYPVLVGASRKAFIAAVAGDSEEARDAGTAAAVAAAVLNGAHIVRVHNAAMMRPVALIAHRIAHCSGTSPGAEHV
jgi:dihydropteroate synthase